MKDKQKKHTFLFVCNSRAFGIARLLVTADKFDDAYSKIEAVYPEINRNDIISVERTTYTDIL